MENIKLIPIEQLFPHPENPRKDLGDLTELADSIKANGVFQNLTVVPLEGEEPGSWDGKSYRVIIGHRRMAASKLAGLTELPCVVVEMTEAEQVKTMLMENMQRSDLTVYEQAQGFQLMLDMGGTVESVAQDTGFSTTTIRRRVKLLELDPERFKKSEARGATLQDYMELDKIEDPELKNEVLDKIGTANFRDALKKAIEEDENRRRMAKWEAALAEFAIKIDKRDYVGDTPTPMEYVKGYGWWLSKGTEVEKPEDAGEVKYYYTVGKREITLYKYRQEVEKTKEEVEAEERLKAMRLVSDQTEKSLKSITKRHFSLRRDFISGFSVQKKHLPEICKYAIGVIIGDDDYSNDSVDADILGELFDLPVNEDTTYPELREMVVERAATTPEYALLACAYAAADADDMGYWDWTWNSKKQVYEYHHEGNEDLDRLYDLLVALGYEMSDEEKAMRDGTHELLNVVLGDADPCAQCKSAHTYCDKCCKTCKDKCNGAQECRKDGAAE